jgi:Cu(I)/Ag(I) efflux system membrane protein CusA/SilA
MIARIILASIRNRFLVLLATVMLTVWGLWAVRTTPLDALPDLSDTQVIIRTPFPGQAPQIVENQVTYPLTTTMLSVPGPRPCAAIPSSATPLSTCCSRTGPTHTGPAPACWST